MSETLTPEVRDARRAEQRQHQRRIQFVIAGVVAAIVLGVVLWLTLGRSSSSTSTQHPTAVPAVRLSVSGLKTLATAVPNPIYWAGPMQGKTLELQRLANGTVYVRYLPPSAALGSGSFLTVATYPMANAYRTVQKLAARDPSLELQLPRGGLGVLASGRPTNIYVAYPKSNYEWRSSIPPPRLLARSS
jgi:hypothetical protein